MPEIVAGVLVAACFKQLLRADGSLLRVIISEPQRGGCERPRFRAGQLSRPENFDACGDCRNLVEDSEARFDDFIGRETCVPNRDSLECVTVANELLRYNELESVDGLSYLISLDDGLPHISNLDSYVKIVQDKATLRRIAVASQQLMNRALMAEDAEDMAERLTISSFPCALQR